jgi:hypothetical protein
MRRLLPMSELSDETTAAQLLDGAILYAQRIVRNTRTRVREIACADFWDKALQETPINESLISAIGVDDMGWREARVLLPLLLQSSTYPKRTILIGRRYRRRKLALVSNHAHRLRAPP